MKNSTNTGLASLKYLLTSAAIVAAMPSYAEYYMGIEGTYMDSKVIFGNGSTNFELAPARIKFGHRYEEFGWEIQALTPSDDTGQFSGSPANFSEIYKLRAGLGILLTASTPGRGFYGGIGFTQILADYSELQNGAAVTSTTHAYPFTTINFGGQINIAKNTRLTLDYTYYHGQIDCASCVANQNLPANTINSDPDVRLSTFGIGLSYSF